MKTVAIYGGSFDPVHLGHVMVVTHLLLNDPEIAEVHVMPCFQQEGKALAPFVDRLSMAQAAFSWLPRVFVNAIEGRLGGESITARTLRVLGEENPDWRMRFVLGGDLAKKAPLWEGWDVVEKLAPPLFVGRAGIAPLEPGDPTPISPAISSSIVRYALGTGNYDGAERYLPTAVLKHIKQRQLYLA